MSKTADEKRRIAVRIVASKSAPRPSRMMSPASRRRVDSGRGTKCEIVDQDSLKTWLQGQGPEVAAIIAARTGLRVVPLIFRRKPRGANEVSAFLVLTSAAFRASALARVAVKYPTRVNGLDPSALVAAARASASAVANNASRDAVGWATLAASALAVAADASDAASASIVTAPGFAAAADAAPSAIRLGAPADLSFLACYAAADPDLRAEVRFDSAAADKLLGAQGLADLRLWSRGPADWAEGAWEGLKLALPRNEGWDVWIDWYKDRLRGGSRGEAHELVFLSAPLDVWDKGPAAANAWIKEHLQKHPGRSGAQTPRPLPGPG